MAELAKKSCVPCEGSAKSLTVEKAKEFLKSTSDVMTRLAVQGLMTYLKNQIKLLERVVCQSRERYKGVHVKKRFTRSTSPKSL